MPIRRMFIQSNDISRLFCLNEEGPMFPHEKSGQPAGHVTRMRGPNERVSNRENAAVIQSYK